MLILSTKREMKGTQYWALSNKIRGARKNLDLIQFPFRTKASRIIFWVLPGFLFSLNCREVLNSDMDENLHSEGNSTRVSPQNEQYPITIPEYNDYRAYLNEFLLQEKVELTKEEVVAQVGKFINKQKTLIGACIESLKLVDPIEQRKIYKETGLSQTWFLEYTQENFDFKIVESWGRVRCRVENGMLSFIHSTIIPEVLLPLGPFISNAEIRANLFGETLKFPGKKGWIEYKVSDDAEITFKDLVIYPIDVGNSLEIRLCRKVELVASSIGNRRWVIFYDAITGELIFSG